MGSTVAHMVVRNEMGRWLPLTLPRLRDQFDAVVVFDDRSTDGTFDFARDIGCDLVCQRGDDTPSFDEDESACRQKAWQMMIDVLGLDARDVVVAVDADEVLIGDPAGWTLDQVLADYHSTVPVLSPEAGLSVPIRELWGITEDGLPLRRVDGFWRDIVGWRVAPADPGHTEFAPGYGCGSVPHRFKRGGRRRRPVIYHLGYVHPDDRAVKHRRHSRAGHSSRHIESILTPPSLESVDDVLSLAELAFFERAARHAEKEPWGNQQQ